MSKRIMWGLSGFRDSQILIQRSSHLIPAVAAVWLCAADCLFGPCVSSLWPLWQINTNWVAYKIWNLIFLVLEGRSPKSASVGGDQGVSGAMLRLGSRGESGPGIFRLLVAAGILWLMATSYCFHGHIHSSSSVCASNLPLPPSYTDTLICI